jgi:hypothetical protein
VPESDAEGAVQPFVDALDRVGTGYERRGTRGEAAEARLSPPDGRLRS